MTAAEGGSGPTGGWVEDLLGTARAVYRLTTEKQLSLLAAAIAYYAFVSMVPLAVLGVAVATTVGGEALSARIVALAGELLGPASQEVLGAALRDRTGLGGVTVVGGAVLVWGALKAFRALDRAFSLVYGAATKSFADSVQDALVVLVAMGAASAAVFVAGAVVALLPGTAVGPLGAVGLAATLLVLFLPVYYRFPDVPLSLRGVLPGAALSAVGWTVLGAVFQVYATTVATASIYGFLGAVLLALTWFYLGSLTLLIGAAVNAVRSGHASPGDR